MQLTPIIKKPVEKIYEVQFDYTQINEVMTIVKQFNCTILQQEMQLFCKITIGIAIKHLTEVLPLFKELKGVEIGEENLAHKQ